VLLAVVLIVALVSVALLGFFPGMASDSQRAQSEMYWKSASPIAITEWAARLYPTNGQIQPYFRVKNNGAYPVRITAIVGADGGRAYSSFGLGCGVPATGWYNTSDNFYLAPGEEKYFGPVGSQWYGLPCDRTVYAITGASTGAYVGGASSICQNSTSSPGTLIWQSLGFEYIAYIEGQQITKRQVGKQVIIKCLPPY